jgi:DNA excision repair protein ERCC-4
MAVRGHMHIVPEDVVFLVDTREQNPLSFQGVENRDLFRVEPATLATGDYSVKGLHETEICVERKSLEDLVQCVGRERERFEKELRRMRAFPARLVVVEGSWDEIKVGNWRSQIYPDQVMGSIMRWMTWGVPFFLHPDRGELSKFVANFMWLHTKTCYARLQCFHKNLRVVSNGA